MSPKLVRVQINVGKDWKVVGRLWHKDPATATVLFTREMRKRPDGKGGVFPTPAQPPSVDDSALQALLTGDAQVFGTVYEGVLRRKPENVLILGKYLFETLIGDAWDVVLSHPSVQEADLLELALAWDRDDANLHRLNWEMMAQGENFLVVHPQKKVAFTRIVQGTGDLQARPIACPPRMLFVIGTDLDDPSIRPGAEFLALVRQMEGKTGCSVHSHLILKASMELLTSTVDWYQPDVIYFICHGNIDKKNRGYIFLMDRAQVKPEAVYADQLAEAIRSTSKTPSVVILNACYSGQTFVAMAPTNADLPSTQAGGESTSSETVSMGGPTSAPLAAGLVLSGIPIVIAMAGRVSDNACRLFTSLSGEAMLEGESVTVAAARGRRAAHLEGGSNTKSVDWGFPTIFMAESVLPDYRPVDPATIAAAKKIEARLKGMPLGVQPENSVFCGREEFFSAYQSLFQEGGPRILCCQVSGDFHGYGKTRLLKELGALSLRENRIPCIFLPGRGTNREPPSTPGMLAFRILESSANARKALGMPPPRTSQVLELIQLNMPGAQASSPEFTSMLQFQNFMDNVNVTAAASIGAKTAGDALRSDLIQFSKEAQTDVVVLLDDIHFYDKALSALLQDWLTGFGLGDAETPVPVIVTFSRISPGEQCLKPFIESSNPYDVALLELGPFRSDGKDPLFSEDILAYERVFLKKLISELPTLAINPNAISGIVEKSVLRFRKRIQGIPSKLMSETMTILGEDCMSDKFFIEFDDDFTIKRMKELGLY